LDCTAKSAAVVGVSVAVVQVEIANRVFTISADFRRWRFRIAPGQPRGRTDELKYLNKQPTSFALPSEAVDRLRAAAGKMI